jgi:hypothetical protein
MSAKCASHISTKPMPNNAEIEDRKVNENGVFGAFRCRVGFRLINGLIGMWPSRDAESQSENTFRLDDHPSGVRPSAKGTSECSTQP